MAEQRQRWICRYSVLIRVAHWLNFLRLAILMMSGLQIFNAHPALYWGEDSDFERPILSISTAFTAGNRPVGVARRACAASGRTTAWVQDGEIPDPNRGHRSP